MKYTGAFAVLGYIVTWMFFSKNNFGNKVKGVLILASASAVLFAPWAIDNYISTGNPVYPMFNTFFGVSGNWEQVSLGSVRPGGWFEGHTLIGFLTLPFKLTTGSCDCWLSPLIIAVLPMALFLRRKDRGFMMISLFSIVLYSGLFLLPYWLVRFFVPLMPALAIMSGYIFIKAGGEDEWLQKTLAVLLVITISTNLGFLALKAQPMAKAALGLETKDDYLSKTLGWYSANKYLESKLRQGEKVAVYGAQLFYRFDFPYLHDLQLNTRSAEKAAGVLKKMNVKYVL
jgi:TctA family transporter